MVTPGRHFSIYDLSISFRDAIHFNSPTCPASKVWLICNDKLMLPRKKIYKRSFTEILFQLKMRLEIPN